MEEERYFESKLEKTNCERDTSSESSNGMDRVRIETNRHLEAKVFYTEICCEKAW